MSFYVLLNIMFLFGLTKVGSKFIDASKNKKTFNLCPIPLLLHWANTTERTQEICVSFTLLIHCSLVLTIIELHSISQYYFSGPLTFS